MVVEVPYVFAFAPSPSYTVGFALSEIKSLAQDEDTVRYTQQRYFNALNIALAEGFRLRPEFFRNQAVPPIYEIGDDALTLAWPPQYIQPLILYCVGHLELTDAQGNEDPRAAALMTAFVQKLTGGKS